MTTATLDQDGYPPLPTPAWSGGGVAVRLAEDAFTGGDMRAYVDADRAAQPQAEMSDEQLIAHCRAAGITWVEPHEESGFRGAFDMPSLPEMHRLVARLRRPSNPVDAKSSAVTNWPYRCEWSTEHGGYVVWRDVFEGNMKCTHAQAVSTHRRAVFVIESEALKFCDHMNAPAQPLAADPATAAIEFALSASDGMQFLHHWNEGNFEACRRDWPDATDDCYIGADPLFKPAGD